MQPPLKSWNIVNAFTVLLSVCFLFSQKRTGFSACGLFGCLVGFFIGFYIYGLPYFFISLLHSSHSKQAPLFPYSASLIANANCDSSCSQTAAWSPDLGLPALLLWLMNVHRGDTISWDAGQVKMKKRGICSLFFNCIGNKVSQFLHPDILDECMWCTGVHPFLLLRGNKSIFER